ncbi:hypothetical protein DOY81_010619 [Sarcophaga bullata]|nr:hypothetical protein DOY81_010619 [Sarcophaga bullata]
MHIKYVFSLTVMLAFLATTTVNVDARRIRLRPLSAKEVVRILKAAGREDAIPEGRVVTQGIAAITGFALGLTKGIGGAMLVDMASSNATQQFIQDVANYNYTGMMPDFQGINMTALWQMIKGSSATNSSGITYKTTEICFDTRVDEPVAATVGRSARGHSEEYDYDDEDADADEDNEMARQATVSSPPATSPTVAAATGAATGSGTADTGDIDTGSAAGTAAGTNTDTGTGSNVDAGAATTTNSNTMTQTDGGTSQTCIVFEKPIVRKRRSMRGRRRLRSILTY